MDRSASGAAAREVAAATARCPCPAAISLTHAPPPPPACSFALFLNHLPDLHSQQQPDVLLQAVQKTIATISRCLLLPGRSRSRGGARRRGCPAGRRWSMPSCCAAPSRRAAC